ncbi:MuF-C-terminal domain-containing protein [Neisseria musculi]|uniref:Primase C terminal 2 domain protein n=1 Tax=Neisseria musculi TaxID=1815583 RepID=A0A7H1M9E9_9NEIS|nr:hypothetical protein [Neisseria musculi]QNT58264.1 primase C terminal 2 domain protein [Neisseria musculi]
MRTVSGRETLPLPDHYQNREYKTENALGLAISKYWKAWDMWLMREAFTEAQANRDTVNARAFKRNYNKAANEKKGYAFSARGSVLSESDRETVTNYLFKDWPVHRDPFYEEMELEDGSGKFSRSESTRQKYEQRIDELFNGSKPNMRGVTVLDLSDMLDMLGYGNMPVNIVESKVSASRDNHPLMTAAVWKKIPDWIDNPAAVFESDTVKGRMVFIAPEKVSGRPVRIVLEAGKDALNAHILINAYDADSKMPWQRWVKDGLLKYADIGKAQSVLENSADKGALPSDRPNRSSTDAQAFRSRLNGLLQQSAGRKKILTEKNLQGYRKNNPDARFERSESRPSEISAERIAELESAVVAAVGKKNAALIDVVALDDISRPDNAEDLLNAQGWFDPKTGRITLIADNLPNADTAKFVAWHESAHRKIHVEGLAKWSALLRQADGNTAVKSLADAVMKQRRGYRDTAAANRMAAVEEAIAELYAAKQENNLEALERKYGISLPAAFKDGLGGYLARVAGRIKNILKDALGIGRDAFSDGQVFGLLRRIDAVKPSEKGVEPLAGDTRYSLNEDAQSDFARAVDAVVDGKVNAGFIKLGKTPAVLKMLGIPDGVVRISGGTIEKAIIGSLGRKNAYDKNRHSLRPEDMKKLPKQLNNPIAVFESTTKKDAFVVLTELVEHENGKDKPVIAALHISKGKRDVDLVDIASVYGRHDKQLENAFNNNLLYMNKEKGRQFLKTRPLQLHWDITSDADLSNHNIKTDSDLAQYESKFSRASDGQHNPNGRADMGKEERGWFNEMGELNVGLAAYNKLSEIIKTAAESVGLARHHWIFT